LVVKFGVSLRDILDIDSLFISEGVSLDVDSKGYRYSMAFDPIFFTPTFSEREPDFSQTYNRNDDGIYDKTMGTHVSFIFRGYNPYIGV